MHWPKHSWRSSSVFVEPKEGYSNGLKKQWSQGFAFRFSQSQSLSSGFAFRFFQSQSLAWLKAFFHKWRADGRGRTRAAPHIKSFAQIDPTHSKAAWWARFVAKLSLNDSNYTLSQNTRGGSKMYSTPLPPPTAHMAWHTEAPVGAICSL